MAINQCNSNKKSKLKFHVKIAMRRDGILYFFYSFYIYNALFAIIGPPDHKSLSEPYNFNVLRSSCRP